MNHKKGASISFVRSSVIVSFLLLALTSHAQTLGIDVSDNNGTINWTNVQGANITFAWAKATEGTSYKDPTFAANETNGKAMGIYMGAYHFAHPEKDAPESEAAYFWNVASNYVKNDGKTFMPMLDYETFTGTFVGASSYADWANQWCADVQAMAAADGVSVVPVIYLSACNTPELSSLDNWTIPWIANYNGDGPGGNPWEGAGGCTENEIWGSGAWTLWQYTSTATISGVTGSCDEDVFNASLSTGLVPIFLAGQITTTTLPTNVTVTAGSSATFTVNATTSGATPAYQWRFNQKNIAGATTNTYTVTNAQPANAGFYSVLVTNSSAYIVKSAFLSVIGALANGANSQLDPSNMVNWWAAEGNGDDIYGTNNASPNGNMVYTNGKVGLAYRLDGSTTYLPVTGATEFAPNWTACMWVYHMRSKCTAATLLGDQTYALKIEQYSNTDDVGISHSGVADYLFSPAYFAPLNTWTHLAFVGTSSAVTLYTNGVQEGTVTVSGFDLPRSFIGVDEFSTISGVYSDFTSGALDEIQIFNRALSASEIKSIFNAGSAGLVRAPQFTSITNLGNGQITLNLIGQTGKPITVKSSPDLINWSTAGTVQNNTGATNFTGSTTAGQQFYQATQKY